MELISLLEKGIVHVPFSTCWYFVGAGRENRNGYSRVWYKGKEHMAHRLVYEALVGPIPPGLVLDHTCRNRCCCSPDHLEPVTVKENTYRGEALLFGRDVHPVTKERVCA